MTRKDRYRQVLDFFRGSMPDARTELRYANPFQLLCAVILSAQCTDKRVNMVTPALFSAFPSPQSMAGADAEALFPYVRSVSYPNNKAAHLAAMSKMLVERHGGVVPDDFDALLALPGVGRKTANVVLSVAFGEPRMAVDTHVYRVSHRLALVPPRATTPLAVERELVRHIPPADLARAHHWLILHGRYVCKALKPRCAGCGLRALCPSCSV